jgi:hypothetical protein
MIGIFAIGCFEERANAVFKLFNTRVGLFELLLETITGHGESFVVLLEILDPTIGDLQLDSRILELAFELMNLAGLISFTRFPNMLNCWSCVQRYPKRCLGEAARILPLVRISVSLDPLGRDGKIECSSSNKLVVSLRRLRCVDFCVTRSLEIRLTTPAVP